jgi:hypothetical protein
MASSLVIPVGGHHHHRQIGTTLFDLAKQFQPGMLMSERTGEAMTVSNRWRAGLCAGRRA